MWTHRIDRSIEDIFGGNESYAPTSRTPVSATPKRSGFRAYKDSTISSRLYSVARIRKAHSASRRVDWAPAPVHPPQLSNIFDGAHDLSLKPGELCLDPANCLDFCLRRPLVPSRAFSLGTFALDFLSRSKTI